jgi:AbiV family abortive infection protein
MDKDTCMKGFRLTYENAKRLFNIAETLEHNKEFPIANSLLILSAEEGMKAYIVLTQHFFPERILDDFDRHFEDHKTKLDSIRSTSGISHIMSKFKELHLDPILENFIDPKEDHQIVKERSEQNFLDWVNKEAESDNTDIAKENNWWRQANTMKQNGIYVGFNKGNKQWTLPSSINKAQYLKTKKYVDNFLKQIEVLYNLDYDDKDVNEMTMEIKQKIIERKNKKINK